MALCTAGNGVGNMAKSKKAKAVRFAILCTLLFLFTQAAAGLIASLIISVAVSQEYGDTAHIQARVTEMISSNLILIAIFGNLLFLAVVLLVARRHRTTPLSTLRLHRAAASQYLLPVLVILFFSSSWNMAWEALPLPQRLMGNVTAIEQAAQGNMVLFFIAIAVIGPIAEEIAFRKIIMSRLRGVMPATPAIAINALLFGLTHGITGSVTTVVFAFIGGIIFALAYEKTGSVLVAVVTHTAGNLCDFVPRVSSALLPAVQYVLIGVLMVCAVITFMLLLKKPSGLVRRTPAVPG